MAWGHENLPAAWRLLIAFALVACSSPTLPADPAPTTPKTSTAPPPTARASASATAPVVSIAKPEPPVAAPKPPAVSKSIAETILGARDLSGGACPAADDQKAIRCWIEKRYESEPSAKSLALAMFDRSGHVAGVEAEHQMDGGFRGTIHIVPEWPLRQYRKHLEWVTASADDFAVFFDKLGKNSDKSVRYRHRAIAFKFLRSVNRRTPSAYASEWAIGYNVSGSLHASVDAVRETLFHEIFHLNDPEHAVAQVN